MGNVRLKLFRLLLVGIIRPFDIPRILIRKHCDKNESVEIVQGERFWEYTEFRRESLFYGPLGSKDDPRIFQEPLKKDGNGMELSIRVESEIKLRKPLMNFLYHNSSNEFDSISVALEGGGVISNCAEILDQAR